MAVEVECSPEGSKGVTGMEEESAQDADLGPDRGIVSEASHHTGYITI